MTDKNAYFLPVLDPTWENGQLHEVFQATDLTLGTWYPGIQHGSPPTGLLTRALNRFDGAQDRRLVRLTVDILAPVPATEIKVVSYTLKPGRNIELIGAELKVSDDGQERTVARATGWRFSTADSSQVMSRDPNPLPPVSTLNDEPGELIFPEIYHRGFTGTLDWRIVEPMDSPEPTTAWIRTTTPLVHGEKTTPIEQVGTLADFANGLAAKVSPEEWTFMNTDLTINFVAPPAGDWLAMTASSSLGPDGSGVCLGTFYDEAGLLGHVTQSLFVRPRSPQIPSREGSERTSHDGSTLDPV